MSSASGAPAAPTSRAIAAATGTPGSAPARSPTSWTVLAPWAPRTAALAAASGPQVIASTVPARPRAAVSSSRLVVEIPAVVGSQRTHRVRTVIPSSLSDGLVGLEERDDAPGAVALVLHDLALAARLCGHDVDDLLARAGGAHLAVEAEVRDRHGVDGLRLGRHDPLERRVPRLDDARGDGDHARQRAGHLVVARLGLALDAHGRAVDRDRLGERDRRQAEQLGELHGRRARVAVRRLGRGEHE